MDKYHPLWLMIIPDIFKRVILPFSSISLAREPKPKPPEPPAEPKPEVGSARAMPGAFGGCGYSWKIQETYSQI